MCVCVHVCMCVCVCVLCASMTMFMNPLHAGRGTPKNRQQHTMTMFMNPLHAGFASSSVAEDQANDDFQEPPLDVKLDSDLYVQPADRTNASDDGAYEAPYSLFRPSGCSERQRR
jgi:hypothetical protein